MCQGIIKIAGHCSSSCYKLFKAMFNIRKIILKENAGGCMWRNVSAVLRYNENGKVFPLTHVNSAYLHLSFLSSNFNFPHVRAQT